MTPLDFKDLWLANGDKLLFFQRSAVGILQIPDNEKSFLIEVGFPEDAAPFLSFGDKHCTLPGVNEMWGQPKAFERYRVLGGNGSGDPICIDEKLDGRVVYLNHDDEFKVEFMNSSVTQLAFSLLHFREVVQNTLSVNGEDAVLDGNFPGFVVDDFIRKMEETDAAAIKAKTFWFNTIMNEGY